MGLIQTVQDRRKIALEAAKDVKVQKTP